MLGCPMIHRHFSIFRIIKNPYEDNKKNFDIMKIIEKNQKNQKKKFIFFCLKTDILVSWEEENNFHM